MRSKMIGFMLLVATAVISSPASAGNNEPLDLSPAEALKLWVPSEGDFFPRMRADPGKVVFAEDVTVAYTVTKRGRTKDVELIDVKPAGANAAWALSAVRAMRFEPTEANQARQPVRSQLSTRWSPATQQGSN
jgi:hypothetical protein